MKKLKLIPAILGACSLSVMPVFTSSCSSNTIKAEQVIILGESSTRVAVEHNFSHKFTAYVLPTAAPQTVKWSLNIDDDNIDIKPYVNISETGVLSINQVPSSLANKKFTINVVATDTNSSKVSDSVPFVINVDEKLQIIGDSRVIYRNQSGNAVGPWTINASLDGSWEITNWDTAKSNNLLIKDYFDLVQNNNVCSIQPNTSGSWTDLNNCTFNLELKFIPEKEEYKDAFDVFNIKLDIFENDSMILTPSKDDNNYQAKVNTTKLFTISNYGEMTFDGLVTEYAPVFILHQISLKSDVPDPYYIVSDEAIEEGEDTFTVDSTDRKNRAETTSPFTIQLNIHNSTYVNNTYYLEMNFYGPGLISVTQYTYYFSNFIQVIQ